jgi:CHAT domain-containing protein
LNGSFDILLNSAATAEMMVKILESIRLNLGEEESRLLLGERYRDSYMFAIECFNKCYDITNEFSYIEKVFEYSEKSKAASLLSYTREAKGLKYHIPPELAEMEQELNFRVGFYESKLSGEQNSNYPDKKPIDEWTENLIIAQGKRDSLIEFFEKNYPGYYKLKYDTKVVSSKDVPSIIGKKVNYVSYIVNDTSLHIILVNSKYTVIKTVAIDSSFLERINSFRQLLSDPVKERNTRDAFLKFQSDGYKFYSLLLEPVTDYFISNRLIISPDDELSFFPFEVLLYAETRDSSLFYNNLNYLMKKYDISYAYSATLLSETRKVRPSFFNNALVIAPSYGSPVSIEASSKERNIFLELPALQYAREEAVYVSKIIPGKIFTDNQATEEAYKNEAGNYDIVHLAMHTVVDGVSPVNSGMVFYQKDTASEDVFLRLYEIYRVPLNSKMVVLSSCYTGSGTLYAGEGVLSLARGFILSGSSSVVMALWEVNDKAAAEIIKSFYKNIKAGLRKSQALKKARIKFLEKSDMLQSHPYYWSTLVIYGDDSQLYIRWQIKVIVLLILAMVLIALIYYFRKR